MMNKTGMKREGILRAAGKNNLGICDEVWHAAIREDRNTLSELVIELQDMEVILEAGYVPTKSVCVDMFPWTRHVGTVVLLNNKFAKAKDFVQIGIDAEDYYRIKDAKLQNRRAIILETQSCNARAISFYRSQGFELIGYDTCCYTNRDIARHEIRFNFGYFMDDRAGRR